MGYISSKDYPPSLSSSTQSSLYNSSTSSSSSTTGGGGGLDNLMADLMQSITDDIQLQPSQQQEKSQDCYACDQAIFKNDRVRSLNNRQYHDECLVCHLCRSPANYQHQEKYYCERDYYVVKSRMACGTW